MGNFVNLHKGSAARRLEERHRNKKNLTKKDNVAYYFLKRRDRFSVEEATKLGAESYVINLQMNEELMDMSQIDLTDAEQVRNRIREYFGVVKKYKQKPTVAGLALALGTNREKMKRMAVNANGRTNENVSKELQKVYLVYENLWEGYMLNGDIPSLNGIFIGKNQFGYKDVVEQNNVVEVKPQIDTEAIRMKYIGADNELPEKAGQDE